jgi:hypothetical protein
MDGLDSDEEYFVQAMDDHPDFEDALQYLIFAVMYMLSVLRRMIQDERYFDMSFCVWRYFQRVRQMPHNNTQQRLQAFQNRIRARNAEDSDAEGV